MNQTDDPAAQPSTRLTGRLLFVAALLVYAATMSPVFYPGDSAELVLQHLPIAIFPAMTHAVWGWCVRLVAAVPVSTAAIRLNALSVLCSAFAVWLLFQLVVRIRHDRTFEESMARFSAGEAQRFSAIVAALSLIVSLPFWIVSTRAHTLSFDVALALLSFYLLIRFGEASRRHYLYGSVLLYGIGITEFATMIPLAVLYAVMLAFALYRAGMFRVRMILGLAGLFLIGLSPYFISAWMYAHAPAYEWRAFESYFQVLWYTWREQYLILTQSLPRVGWLTVGIVSVVPWLIVWGFRGGGRPTTRGVWFGTFLLNGLLTVLAVALLFNFTLSPWAFSRGSPLLVMPYVFIAMWTSYVAGYWYVMIVRSDREGRARRKQFAIAYAAVVFALLATAAVRNLPLANGHTGTVAAKFADAQLNSLQGQTWIVTAGEMDDSLALAAWERGMKLQLLNPRYAESDSYGRYVASLFREDRYKSLARVGLIPLLGEWMKNDPTVVDKLAIVNAPDLWAQASLGWRPEQTLFVGERPGAKVDLDALVQRFHAFWDDYGSRLRAVLNQRSLVWVLNRQIAGYLAKMANNLGVYLEDHERSDLAFDMYREARGMDTNNLSALINMHTLAKREGRPELQDIEAELTALAKATPGRFHLWSLSYFNGYVRSPELYASRGWAWAMSGKANLAVADMKRALEMSGDNPAVQLALAGIYFSQDKSEESREAYLNVLTTDEKNLQALLGLARLAIRSGDFDAAHGYLNRLRELKAPARLITMEEAVMETMSGNAAGAAARLSEIVKDEPDNMRAWAALAVAATQANDQRLLQSALGKLQSAKMVSPSIRLALAQIALNQSDTVSARKNLEEVLRVRPTSIAALEMMVRLSVSDGRRDEAEKYVDRLITVDPGNALGNYILGSLQVYREQYALAESSYRTSLAAKRTPEVLNDLAWILRRRGANDEALSLVRESLQMDDSNGSAWDTYGSLMMSENRLDEAEKALQRALALRPESAMITLNVALLYEKKGQFNDAQRLAESLMARPTELTREAYDDLRELLKRLRANT